MLHDSLLVVYVIIEYVYVISGIAINCCILNTINDVSVEVNHVRSGILTAGYFYLSFRVHTGTLNTERTIEIQHVSHMHCLSGFLFHNRTE